MDRDTILNRLRTGSFDEIEEVLVYLSQSELFPFDPELVAALLYASGRKDEDRHYFDYDDLFFAKTDPSSIPVFRAGLHSSSEYTRDLSIRLLGYLGAEDFIPEILAALSDDSHDVRAEAAQVLGDYQTSEAIPELVRHLRDESNFVIGYITLALGKIGNRSILGPLRRVIRRITNDMAPNDFEPRLIKPEIFAGLFLLGETRRLRSLFGLLCWNTFPSTVKVLEDVSRHSSLPVQCRILREIKKTLERHRHTLRGFDKEIELFVSDIEKNIHNTRKQRNLHRKTRVTQIRKKTGRKASMHPTITNWITGKIIPFSKDSPRSLDDVAHLMMTSLGGQTELLGFGEAMHGGSDILVMRNHLFRWLAEKYLYRAIVMESSFPRAKMVNDYITGCSQDSLETVLENGFSHGFGRLAANRELVEWMKEFNDDPMHDTKIRFYGFDGPMEMTGTDSPRQLLNFVLDYFSSIDSADGNRYRQRIEKLLGNDADWENPAAMMDPSLAIGLSPEATALRIEMEDLIAELQIRRPELAAKTSSSSFLEALQYAIEARQLLTYHAELAKQSDQRTARLLGIRDALMADNVAYIMAQEQERGRVFLFAHNSHLKRGKAQWQLGENLLTWWPAGAHLDVMYGPRYAVIGTGVTASEPNGIAPPEPGTLEALLSAETDSSLFIPTHRGKGLPASETATLPTRSGSTKNYTYFPLTPESITDFDCLAILDSSGFDPGITPLQ